MKNFFLLSFFAAFCACSTLSAAILTVDNATPSPGQFTTMVAAITAASAGDTILVKGNGSSKDYGTFRITKSLAIIGSGHKPQGQSALVAYCGTIEIGQNVDNVSISGFDCNYIYAAVGGSGANDNIIIENCNVRNGISFSSTPTGSTNWLVRNNIMESFNINSISNVVVQNNVIRYHLEAGGAPGWVINGNLFTHTSANHFALNGLNTAVVSNNIFYGPQSIASSTVVNCAFAKNISDDTGTQNALPPVGGGGNTGAGNNLVAQTAAQIAFVSVPAPVSHTNGFQYANDYRLQVSSVGHNYGTDGTDVGLYNAGNIFNETGEPARPVVSLIEITNSTLPTGGTLNVNFSARNAVKDAN